MFETARSLRWASWAALLLAVAYVAAAAAVPGAQRKSPAFTIAEPTEQLEDVVRFFGLGIVLAVFQFIQSMAGVLAMAALAARSPGRTPGVLGGALAAFAFLVLAARGIWSAVVEPSAGLQFVSTDNESSRNAMVVFMHHNLLFKHFFNWTYVFLAGCGFGLLAASVWGRVRKLGAALAMAGVVHALYFPALMYVYYSTKVLKRPVTSLLVTAEVAIWLFPGLAFVLLFFWLWGLMLSVAPEETAPGAGQ